MESIRVRPVGGENVVQVQQPPLDIGDIWAPWRDLGLPATQVREIDKLASDINKYVDLIKQYDSFRNHEDGITITQLRSLETRYFMARAYIASAKEVLESILPYAEIRGTSHKQAIEGKLLHLQLQLEEMDEYARKDTQSARNFGFTQINMFRDITNPPAPTIQPFKTFWKLWATPLRKKYWTVMSTFGFFIVFLFSGLIILGRLAGDRRRGRLVNAIIATAWFILRWWRILLFLVINQLSLLEFLATGGDRRHQFMRNIKEILQLALTIQAMNIGAGFLLAHRPGILAVIIRSFCSSLVGWVPEFLAWWAYIAVVGALLWQVDAFMCTIPQEPIVPILLISLDGMAVLLGLALYISTLAWLDGL